MLGKFLKRDSDSALPKNQIEVVCPVCGAAQREPRLVVTTFCRKCGEHLRIEKRGRVIASSQINPVPSAIYPTMQEKSAESSALRADVPPVEPAAPVVSEALVPDKNIKAEDVPLGLGHMMGFKDEEEPAPSKKTSEPPKKAEQQEKTAPVVDGFYPAIESRNAPSASQSTLGKMKEQGQFRQHYFKEVECFECHNKFKVGRSAKSTNCPSCGHYICLEDFDINLTSTTPIRTRGDVLIRKPGVVQTTEIICRDLRVFGTISGAIECSGEFFVRASGTIIGEVHCKKLVVEKGSDINFMNTVHAEDVDVRARVNGNIHCTGQVRIGATGWVHGDVTARSVAIEPGGQLDGAMNIVRGTAAAPRAIVESQAPAVNPE